MTGSILLRTSLFVEDVDVDTGDTEVLDDRVVRRICIIQERLLVMTTLWDVIFRTVVLDISERIGVAPVERQRRAFPRKLFG